MKLVVVFLAMIAIPLAYAGVDPSKLIKVTGDSNQKCVEYYSYQGESYCSETAFSTETPGPEIKDLETQTIHFDQRPWLAAWFNKTDQSVTIEYVPMGESITNWQELVTSQFFAGLQEKVTPEAFMGIEMQQLEKAGFKPIITVIKNTPEVVLFEFQIASPQEHVQDELQKITKGSDGIYVLHYVKKQADMGSETRQAWIKNLLASTIKHR